MAKNEPEKKDTEQEKSLTEEVVDQMTKLAASGFGLVAALAWNSAIQDLFDKLSSIDKNFSSNGLQYKFVYAILITLLVVSITYYLSRLANRVQNRKK